MPSPSSIAEFVDLVRRSGVLDDKRLDAYLERLRPGGAMPPDPPKLAGQMVSDGLLTTFQAEQFLQGKWRRFTIGKYKVLEKLGAGGMGSVYLCEHKLMRRRVAVKVLPTAKADDPAALERFYREARAVAALDHPNIVRAYDIDQDEKLHFLVMEFVDGANLQEIIKKTGPMDPLRVAHYMFQSALGLQHAHETAGLVHRDIKPGNILVDRNGIVKVLDMGLARFFHDEEDLLTKKYDENVLGTADYLAPEQALDSHGVDIRADVYSLGATFYFCLTGRPPFAEGTVAQKLIWHQTRQPKAIKSLRTDVPDALVAVIERMMAKDPSQRYQTPQAVVDVLAPLTQTPIPPPPDVEMPQLSRAAQGVSTAGEASRVSPARKNAAEASSSARKVWQVPGSGATPTLPKSPSAGPGSNPPALELPRPPTPAPARSPEPAPVPARLNPAMASAAPPPAAADASSRPASKVATQPAPAPSRGVEDECPSWDQLELDTQDLTARMDTDPRSGHRAGRSSRSRLGRPPLTAKDFRVWYLVGGVSLTALLILILLLWIANTAPNRAPPPPGEPAAAARVTLVVNPRAAGAFPTVAAALVRARRENGATIQVQEDVAEVVTLSVKNVTLEAGRPDLVWKAPPICPPGTKLLSLNNAENCTIRGFSFEGGDRVDTLVQLYGQSPGLTLEDLTLKGFLKNGVVVANCAGTDDRPVQLRGLKISTGSPSQSGLFFTITPGLSITRNEYFSLQDCRFDGQGDKIKTPKPDFLDHIQTNPDIKMTVKGE